MNLKGSLKGKLLMVIIPLIIITFAIVGYLVADASKKAIESEVDSKMAIQIALTKEDVNKRLGTHKMVAKSLQKSAEKVGVSGATMPFLKSMVQSIPMTNDDTFGGGIFMGQQIEGVWFCPYAYKDNGQLAYTEDYAQDNTKEGWYQVGVTDAEMGWTDPYYDPTTDVTMITAAAPIRDSNANVAGVATADLNISNIQGIFGAMKVGEAGHAFLLTKDGGFLAKGSEPIKADDQGLFPNITLSEDGDLKTLGATIIEKKEGSGQYTDKSGNLFRIYYSTVPDTGWIVGLAYPEAEIMSQIKVLVNSIAISTVIAVIIISLMVAYFANRMTRPIESLSAGIASIANGDLTHGITVSSSDEIGEMGHKLELMRQNLSQMIAEIAKTAENVAAASQELTASADQNGQAADQIAVSIQEISSGSQHIESTAQQVQVMAEDVVQVIHSMIDSIQSTSNHLKVAETRSNEGGKVVNEAVDSMRQTEISMSRSIESMRVLLDQSQQIGAIINAIKQIADQTNLLALNASIEAARAGEAGRGFAVVADEIRKLAEQSNGSAEQISQIISMIESGIKTTERFSTESGEAVSRTSVAVEIVGRSFGEIVEGIQKINEEMSQTMGLVETIQVSTDSMFTSVNGMSDISRKSSEEIQTIAATAEEQSATSTEMSKATESLAEMASSLQEDISRFRV